jgi:sterol O-acyltransferase
MSSEPVSQACQSIEESAKRLRLTLTESLKELSKLQDYSNSESQVKLMNLREKMYTLLDDRLMDSKARFKARVTNIMSDFNSDLDACAERAHSLLSSQLPARPSGEKVHIRQSTPISRLLYNKDWRTVYNIFFAFMVNIGIVEFVREITEAESYLFGWDVIESNFSNIRGAVYLWTAVFLFSFISVGLVQVKRWGVPRAIVLLVHFLSIGYGVYYSCLNARVQALPLASCIMFMCEALRLLLKMHSYVREKLLRDASSQMPVSDLVTETKRFLYFSFAPTLIYRDSYPILQRNIRWSHAFVHVINFFATIFYTTILFKGFCLPAFATASHMRSIPGVLHAWIVSTLPGTMVFLNVFFGVSHSFFSFFAEMLQFADRGFYGDWWNAKDFTTLFSKVSLVLTDWVETYIYLDSQRIWHGIKPWMARLLVFLFAMALCEVVLSVSVGFLYPLPFVLFAGPCMCLITAYTGHSPVGNILVWVALILMNGLMLLLYFLEYDAVQQAGVVDMTERYGVLGYFVPQLVARLQY